MTSGIDKDAVNAAYEDVRDDGSETSWFTLRYDDKQVVFDAKGSDYQEFLERFSDAERIFAYARFTTGDEMSKRAKFAFIAWVGAEVSPLKKAKVSVDKAVVKQIVKSFAQELLVSEMSDLKYESVKEKLVKAGGANYGTGLAS